MPPAQPGKFIDIDWENWVPDDVASECFIIRQGEILLIRKKRGLGAGKIIGPGGRQEPGESIRECVVREVLEETGVTPLSPRHCGELRFQFQDGYGIHVHVFTATDFRGEICETEEALPLWTPVDRIPFDEMWQDDIVWVPWMLEGHRFEGRYLFDGDRMVDHQSRVLE